MSHTNRIAQCLLASALLASATGCTYVQERRDLMSGAPQQREAAAQSQLDAERQRAAGLNAQRVDRERDLNEINGKLSRAQSSLDEQNRKLAAALRNKRISQAKHDELKREIDDLKADNNDLRARNDGDRITKRSIGESSDAKKLERLRELEQRRHDLEVALQAAVGK